MTDAVRPQGFAEIASFARSIAVICDEMNKMALFLNRGFSDRAIKALIEDGIDAPERLLFMSDAEAFRLHGVGDVTLAEIKAYRSRFLPPQRE